MSFYDEYLKNALKQGARTIRYIKGRAESAFIGAEDGWFCPCCGCRIRRFTAGSFLEHPEIYDRRRFENTDQNVLCPVCRSMPRHRILCDWIDNNLDLLRGKRILYFAANQAVLELLRRKGLAVTTADKYIKSDLMLDLMNLDLTSKTQDVIICNHVIENIDDYRVGLAELKRVLKENGMLIISFPIDGSLEAVFEDRSIVSPDARRDAYGERDCQRLFGRDSAELLEQAGFEVSLIDGKECLGRILPVVGPAEYDVNYLFLCINK